MGTEDQSIFAGPGYIVADGVRPDGVRTRRANLVKRLKEAAKYYDRRVLGNSRLPALRRDYALHDARRVFGDGIDVRVSLLNEADDMRDLLEEAARELEA